MTTRQSGGNPALPGLVPNWRHGPRRLIERIDQREDELLADLPPEPAKQKLKLLAKRGVALEHLEQQSSAAIAQPRPAPERFELGWIREEGIAVIAGHPVGKGAARRILPPPPLARCRPASSWPGWSCILTSEAPRWLERVHHDTVRG